MTDELIQLSNKASEKILSFPKSTKIRVISHYDADGISAAAIVSMALYRAGYNFHTSLMRNPFDKGLARVSKEKNEVIIFSDMGSGQINTIEQLKCLCIILDHHQVVKKKVADHVIQINANLCNINGNYEACGATISYAFAAALHPNNTDLLPLALAGAIGDKQHIGGIRGYNQELLQIALDNKLLSEQISMKLFGDTVFDAVYYSIDPYYPGLSGNKDAIEKLLVKLKIDNTSKVTEINAETKKKLQSYLFFQLIKAGCQQNILDIAIRTRYHSDLLGCELERFADLLDACGKNGFRGLGLSLCFQDSNAFQESLTVEKEYKQKILEQLIALEQGGLQELSFMRYFYSDSSSLGGVVAGIACNYLFDEQKPLFSIARKDNELHVSCRGNQQLVAQGLDLGSAMKQVSTTLGGHGGGHQIAAGATLTLDKEQEFIEQTNQILQQQIGVLK